VTVETGRSLSAHFCSFATKRPIRTDAFETVLEPPKDAPSRNHSPGLFPKVRREDDIYVVGLVFIAGADGRMERI